LWFLSQFPFLAGFYNNLLQYQNSLKEDSYQAPQYFGGNSMKLPSRSNTLFREIPSLLLATILFISPAFGWQSPAVATKTTPALSSTEKEIASLLKVETITETTTTLASRDMEGRGTATPGGEKAAKYIADRFARLGLKPLGDSGTYLQAAKFKGTQVLPESNLKAGETALKLGEDFLAMTFYAQEQSDASGGLVFVGYGVVSQDLKRDDLAGLDLKGKIAILIGGRPKNVDEAAWTKATNPQTVSLGLIQRGAAGIIVVPSQSQNDNFSVIASYLTRRRVSLADAPEPPFKLPPIVIANYNGVEKLFAGTGTTFAQVLAKAETGEMVSKELDKTVSVSLRMKKEEAIGSNVVGMVEGSDEKLKEEAVIYTAHYDAFGMAPNGGFYSGAADNALGVGMLMSIAEAIAKSQTKPKRSTIFLAVTGEEYGLLGAEYWIKHPTWPIDKLAANLNFDGIGTEIYGPVKKITGFGMEQSDLGNILNDVVAATGNSIQPDPMPEEKTFYRSDHYAFVKKGVPAMMLMGCPDIETTALIARIKKWLNTDYHQTTDTVRPDWHWEGARSLATVGLIVGLRVSNTDAMPSWLPSSPFNKVRGTNEQPPPKQ
jgi:Zn-dependent M28 family amino/carboxypeptidase